MTLDSRNKGAGAEREVVALLRDRGYQARRTSDGRVQRGLGDVAGLPRHHLEVKRCERVSLPAWIAQAESDADPIDVPAVIWRSSRMPWRIDLALDDYLDLLERSQNTTNERPNSGEKANNT
ncbi:MAG: hypothetical protein WAP35_09235 [Solirubrobacterales bacterium]